MLLLLSSQYDEEYFAMKREYPDRPIVGVSAVVFDDNRVLLVRRGKEPGTGEWHLPGGAVKLGERLEDAIRREIKEETSVELTIGGLVGVFDTISRDSRNEIKYHYVLIDYWGWIASGRPRAGSDVKELKWIFLNEVETLGIGDSVKMAIVMASNIRRAL